MIQRWGAILGNRPKKVGKHCSITTTTYMAKLFLGMKQFMLHDTSSPSTKTVLGTRSTVVRKTWDVDL